MNNDDTKHLNLFDFFGFPERQKRDEAAHICNIKKLMLLPLENSFLSFLDTYFEQYAIWSTHINNYKSHLWLHFLLMYYQYSQNPLDSIHTSKFQSPEACHKIFFDTFAEDVSLYMISYFDKHLEMFNDLYNLKQSSGKKHNLSRRTIINEMIKIKSLKELATHYKKVETSESFKQVKKIRDNFVHNKSSSYYGSEVTKLKGGVYSSGHSSGISTEKTYKVICILLKSYQQLCDEVNAFIKLKIEVTEKELK